MKLRFITQKIHSYLDYPVALNLLLMPFLLGLGSVNPLAKSVSVVTGAAALILTLLTNHETGLFRVLPFSFHLAVDRLVGLMFLILPFLLGFTGLDAIYYLANGAVVLAVTTLFNVQVANAPVTQRENAGRAA